MKSFKLQGNELVKYSTLFPEFNNASDVSVYQITNKYLKYCATLSPKLLRNYSKKTQCAIEILEQSNLRKILKNYMTERVGIYASGYGHVCFWDAIKEQVEKNEEIYKSMRAKINPRHTLINNFGILPGNLAIHFEIKGPTNAFINDFYSALHAFQKAIFDIKLNKVDLAIVVCTNIYEDPLHIEYNLNEICKSTPQDVNQKKVTAQVLSEAIICCYITKEDLEIFQPSFFNSDYLKKNDDFSYGLLQSIFAKGSFWSQLERV